MINSSEDQEILNLYAGQLKNISKEDYLAARTLYITFNLRAARVMALQALEKLAKAICLMNGIETTALGHDVAEIYKRHLVPLGVVLDDECAQFIASVGNGYNNVRYEMEPAHFCRSEVWLIDRCFFKFLRYSHWYRPNGVLSPNANPLDKEFGDILKSDKDQGRQRRSFLVAETIIDGKSAEEVKAGFLEFQTGNNTFWDSYPDHTPQIFEVLNKFVQGFGPLNRNPKSYDGKSAVKGVIDPGPKEQGAQNLSFAPLFIQASGGTPVNSPPEWSTYFDETIYVD